LNTDFVSVVAPVVFGRRLRAFGGRYIRPISSIAIPIVVMHSPCGHLPLEPIVVVFVVAYIVIHRLESSFCRWAIFVIIDVIYSCLVPLLVVMSFHSVFL
jgi:hypothetical protein